MPQDLGLVEYSSIFTRNAKEERKKLSDPQKLIVQDIIDDLTENPNQYSNRTSEILENVFVYSHPKPNIEITYKLDEENHCLIIVHLVAPKFEGAKPLFISYSHKDKEYLNALRKFLQPLERNNLISIWDDSEIQPGDKWKNEIKEALLDAKLAILLVSQDFINSEFINNNELPQLLVAAEQRDVKILWIAVGPCTVNDTELINYQAIHKDPPLTLIEPPHLDVKLLEIYNKIKLVVEN